MVRNLHKKPNNQYTLPFSDSEEEIHKRRKEELPKKVFALEEIESIEGMVRNLHKKPNDQYTLPFSNDFDRHWNTQVEL